MLKILQVSLQHYMNWELPDVRAGFRKDKRTRDQIANICWNIEKTKDLQKKTSTSVSLTMLKPLTMLIIKHCGKFLKSWEYQTDLTCLLRNLYSGQEAKVRILYETTDWFKIEKGVLQGCLLSPCLFNLYAEHIM